MSGSPFERTRAESCLSDFALDRLVGEGEPHPHLQECARCAARHQEFEEARSRFEASAAQLGRKRAARWPALAMAIAASIAVAVVWPRAPDGFRSKGGPEIFFYVRHGEQVRRGRTQGEAVAPRDAIRFSYTADRPYHLAIFSIDPKGAVSVYYPEGDRTQSEKPGSDIALPLSTVLDETLGRERIVAMFCEQAIDLTTTKRSLETSDGAKESCHNQAFEWIKAP